MIRFKYLTLILLLGFIISCRGIKYDISGYYITDNDNDKRVLILKNNNNFEYIVFNKFIQKDSIQNLDLVACGEWKQIGNKITLNSDDDSFGYPIGEEGISDTLQDDDITSFSFRKFKCDDTIFIKKVNANCIIT